MSPAGIFQWTIIIAGWATIPVITVHYVIWRVRIRQTQLRELFTKPLIMKWYLATKAVDVEQRSDESEEEHRTRLQNNFSKVFEEQFKGEYGPLNYLIPGMLATFVSGLVITVLIRQGFGVPIANTALPKPLVFALLGALFWTVWWLTRGYLGIDITPGTLYWSASRYVLCIPVGLLAKEMFTDTLAALGAFVLSILPIEETIRVFRGFVAGKIPALSPQEGHPPLQKLQGLDQATMARLEERGIRTTQQLAYIDPLEFLFRTNFDATTLNDLMDQAFLYNYIGDKVDQLRSRGIRGGTEMVALRDNRNDTELIDSIAGVLGITSNELLHLVEMMKEDSQLELIWHVWGS